MAKHAEKLALPSALQPRVTPLEGSRELRLLTEAPAASFQAASIAGAAQEVEQRLLERELEIARQIQESLLPKTFPELPGFDLAAFCRNARHVGGDFFDVILLSPGSVLLVIADVMGKGVPAALFAATLRTLLRTMVQWTERPADLLARVNRLMFNELSTVDMFITVQLAVFDSERQQLSVAAAGHCPLLVARGRQVEAVSPEGIPLGIAPDAVFSEACLPLDSSTRVLLYTDGVSEARNHDGEPFGQDRLEEWLANTATLQSTAEELKQRFLEQFAKFQPCTTGRDDQTWLLVSPTLQQHQPITDSPQSPVVSVQAATSCSTPILPSADADQTLCQTVPPDCPPNRVATA